MIINSPLIYAGTAHEKFDPEWLVTTYICALKWPLLYGKFENTSVLKLEPKFAWGKGCKQPCRDHIEVCEGRENGKKNVRNFSGVTQREVKWRETPIIFLSSTFF